MEEYIPSHWKLGRHRLRILLSTAAATLQHWLISKQVVTRGYGKANFGKTCI
jgi:hypothetical protein